VTPALGRAATNNRNDHPTENIDGTDEFIRAINVFRGSVLRNSSIALGKCVRACVKLAGAMQFNSTATLGY
jgi:hypothetical protein